jgi:hypothetical protein
LTQKPKVTLPAWKVISRSSLPRGLWLRNLLMMLFTMLFYQVPGLAMREFFNALSGSAQAGLNLWTIIALLFCAEIGSILGIYGLVTTNVPFFHEHHDPAAQEPAAAHPAPPGRFGPARLARRGHQPLPRRRV